MTFSFDKHEPGCRPLQPCRNCVVAKYLGGILTPHQMADLDRLISSHGEPLERPPGKTTLDELEKLAGVSLSNRVHSALANGLNQNPVTLDAIMDRRRHELSGGRIPNFGAKSLNELEVLLARFDLKLN